MLTQEVLEKRLAGLKLGLQAAIREREEATQRIHAYDGALQECEWALSQYEAEAVTIEDLLPDGMEIVGVEADSKAPNTVEA